jgi:hypothetical protein
MRYEQGEKKAPVPATKIKKRNGAWLSYLFTPVPARFYFTDIIDQLSTLFLVKT